MSVTDYPLETIRSRFPALAKEDEAGPRIYFDNPAGTQVVDSVVEAMTDCLHTMNANLGGFFASSGQADALVDEAHQAMADFLHASSADEIIFGQNMTSLTFHISRSIGRTLQSGDEIIVTHMDHDANVTPWTMLAEDLDLTVRWLPFDTETYEFDLGRLENILNERTRLVCVGAASNLTGTINDVKRVAELARKAGALSYIDAVQLAPHVAIDVQDLGCDFLACSAYKFFGPHQGILYGRRKVLESLTAYKVRPAPKAIPGCFETGTQSHEGMAGTAAAVNYFAWVGGKFGGAERKDRGSQVHAGLGYLFSYEQALARQLIEGLQQFPKVRIQGIADLAAADRRVPTVAFTAEGVHPDHIAREFARRNIFVWSGHNYAVEVVDQLGLAESGGVVRVGPVHYNSPAEIDCLLEVLGETLG